MQCEGRRVLVVVGFAALLCAPSRGLAQSAPSLGTAASFAVLGGSAVTNSAQTTRIAGNVGVSPGNTLTGFPPDVFSIGTTYRNDALARQAQRDVATAYDDLAGRTCTVPFSGQDLGSRTLGPGVYCISSPAALTGRLTLDAGGNPAAVWVFQLASTFTTAPDAHVLAINGGQAGNVFWQVGSSATLGARTAFLGNLLALTSITLNTGASVSGRLLARTGAVTLDTNNVSLCCDPIDLAPPTLPDGTTGLPYNQTITASGGLAPYTFTLISGSLPLGLNPLTSGGALSGTPSKPGTFRFTVMATDSHGCSGARDYTIDIDCPTFVLSPPTLPDATACIPYNPETITASGGSGSYEYSVTSGALPIGLTLDPTTGVLSGPAMTPGDYTFTVTAIDKVTGCICRRTYTLHVKCNVTISPATLPAVTTCSSYCQTLTASCGTAPYTFSVSGTPPAGVSLSLSGVLCLTPPTPGNITFTVTATDAKSCTASRTYTVRVNSGPITISPPTLPNGTVGTPYPSQTIIASDGSGSYTFSVPPGTLPPGLKLNPATGVISDTPTASGSFTFTVTATDTISGCVGSRTYTIVVIICSLTLSPPTLLTAAPGSPYSQTITASGGTGSYTFVVSSGALPPGLALNTMTGEISGTPTATGAFNFCITATDSSSPNPCTATQCYTIVVAVGGPTLSGWGMLMLSVLLAGAGFVVIRRGGVV